MKARFLLFSIGLFLGLALALPCRKSLALDGPSTARATPPAVAKQQVEKTESSFAKRIDSFSSVNRKLSSALVGTKTLLQQAKQRSSALQNQVYGLIRQRVDDTRDIEGQNASDCDSLIATVEYLMQNSVVKDSLQEEVTINLERQLAIKDSTIALNGQQYISLKSSFDKSIENGEALFKDNKTLTSQLKRQKLKSKFLSAAFLVLAGAATGYFITH